MTMIRKFLFWRFLRPLGQTIVKACEYLVGRLTAFILVIEVYQIQSLVTDEIIDQLLRHAPDDKRGTKGEPFCAPLYI